MAAPGAPRQGNDYPTPPPPNYNPGLRGNPNSLADHLHNLNINNPPSLPNSAPRAPTFGQSPPLPGVPVAFPSFSLPGPPPAAQARPAVPPSVSVAPQSSSRSYVAPGRPTGPPVSHPFPFGSRPPPGSLPSSMASPLDGFQPSGSVVPPQVLLGARPTPFASSPSTASTVVPPLSASGGSVSNGRPVFTSGALPGQHHFPPVGGPLQQPLGPPPTMAAAPAPPQAPTMHSRLDSSTVIAPPLPSLHPPGPPVQSVSPFSAAPQATPLPTGYPYDQPTWPVQHGQVILQDSHWCVFQVS